MIKFKNCLTWSFSRDRLFKDCRRAYYYHYYASWGGWQAHADEVARKAYILKNIRNINVWIGDIVHQVIRWILRSQIEGKEISCDEAIKKAKQMLHKTWEQSRSRSWTLDVKRNLNLFEHYYKREPDQKELTLKLGKVVESISNIYGSGLIKMFRGLSQENLVHVDELDSFNFRGVKVFAAPDFAVHDVGYILYDWKTGNPSDKDVLQLSCYVLYAMQKWKVLFKDIRIVPAYLSGQRVTFGFTKPLPPEQTEEYIGKSLKQMMSVLSQSNEEYANLRLCPKTEDSWRCKNCKFKEICR